MESINLLNQALSPYQVSLSSVDRNGERSLALLDPQGVLVTQRRVQYSQLADKRQLTDLVDGFHRDLRVHEGRLDPCIIAAMAGNFAPERLASI